MFVWFGTAKSAETEEVAPGGMLDFDDTGGVIGIEILYVSQRMPRRKGAAEKKAPAGCAGAGKLEAMKFTGRRGSTGAGRGKTAAIAA